jgi:hypothetical protein
MPPTGVPIRVNHTDSEHPIDRAVCLARGFAWTKENEITKSATVSLNLFMYS